MFRYVFSCIYVPVAVTMFCLRGRNYVPNVNSHGSCSYHLSPVTREAGKEENREGSQDGVSQWER